MSPGEIDDVGAGDPSASLGRAQSALAETAAWARDNADAYAAHYLSGTVIDVRVVVTVAGEAPDEECEDLLAHLASVGIEDTSFVDVRAVEITRAESDQLIATIESFLADRLGEDFYSVNRAGSEALPIEVRLLPLETQLADELLATHGPYVKTRLGLFPYPAGSTDDTVNACTEHFEGLPNGFTPGPEPLTDVTLAVPAIEVPAGRQVSVEVTVTNSSQEVVELWSSSKPVHLIDPNSGQLVARAQAAGLVATGFIGPIEPGDRLTTTLLVGTSACRQSDGYAVPPGRYELAPGWLFLGGPNSSEFPTVTVTVLPSE